MNSRILADQLGNPIQTRKADYAHHITNCPTDFQSNLRPFYAIAMYLDISNAVMVLKFKDTNPPNHKKFCSPKNIWVCLFV